MLFDKRNFDFKFQRHILYITVNFRYLRLDTPSFAMGKLLKYLLMYFIIDLIQLNIYYPSLILRNDLILIYVMQHVINVIKSEGQNF